MLIVPPTSQPAIKPAPFEQVLRETVINKWITNPSQLLDSSSLFFPKAV